MSDTFECDEAGNPLPKKASLPMPARYLAPDQRHRSEVDDFGNCPMDTWECIAEKVELELHVCGPQPTGEMIGLARKWGPPVKRRYSLKRGDRVQIASVYRQAIVKVGPGNVAVGGLAPGRMALVQDGGQAVAVKLSPAIDPNRPPPSVGKTPEPGAEGRLRARLSKGGAS